MLCNVNYGVYIGKSLGTRLALTNSKSYVIPIWATKYKVIMF